MTARLPLPALLPVVFAAAALSQVLLHQAWFWNVRSRLVTFRLIRSIWRASRCDREVLAYAVTDEDGVACTSVFANAKSGNYPVSADVETAPKVFVETKFLLHNKP